MTIILGITLLSALIVITVVPKIQTRNQKLDAKERLELENNARGTLVQLAGGIALLVGLYVTWQQLVATQRSVDIARETLQISQASALAGDFDRYVSELASSKLSVRMAGIYSIEQVADTSPEYHWISMQVLSSFVRQKSPLGHTCKERAGTGEHLCTDVQTALQVIGRRKLALDPANQGINVSLVSVHGLHLEGAHLNVPISHKAIKNSSPNPLSVFSNSDLSQSDIVYSDLSAVDFSKDNLSRATLQCDTLTNAMFTGATMNGIKIGCGTFANPDPYNAYVTGAQMAPVDMTGAVLYNADLRNAELVDVNLQYAVLYGARFDGATLRYVDLRGVNLSGTCGLTVIQLKSALTDTHTIPPDYRHQRSGCHAAGRSR
jgi:uncharacterized protein YjbI with pentapeptide repeats